MLEILDQVGYPQEALPTRAGETGPPRTGFLNVGPPKGQLFFWPFLKMMPALKGRWMVLIRASNKVNIGPIPALNIGP